MPISTLTPTLSAEQFIERAPIDKTTSPEGSFAQTLKESIANVDTLMKEADVKMEGIVAGKGENIHEAMIAFEKAESALKMLTQVRNKALEAYNQIIQMQV